LFLPSPRGSESQLLNSDAATTNGSVYHESNTTTTGCVNRNNRSRSRTKSMNWPSNEGNSSNCDTLSVALSEMPDVVPGAATVEQHLVNRKALLERIGIEDNSSSQSQGRGK
jgi:hypothetical protein